MMTGKKKSSIVSDSGAGIAQRSLVLCILVIVLLFLPIKGQCQYYPRPEPIDFTLQKKLETSFRQAGSGPEKLALLVSLAKIHLYKPLKQKSDFDLSLSYAAQARSKALEQHNDSGYNESCLLLAGSLIQNNRIEDAERLLLEVRGEARIDLLLTLAYNYLRREMGDGLENSKKALAFVNEASTCVNPGTPWKIRTNILRIKGAILCAQDNYKESEIELLAALKEAKQKDGGSIQYAYIELAILSYYKGDYDRSLSATLNAVQIISDKKDSVAAGDAHFLLGLIFRNTGQLQKATEQYQQALQCYLKFPGAIYSVAVAIQGIGSSLMGNKQYAKALACYQDYYKKYPSVSYPEKQVETASFGDCYLKLKNFKLAEKYFIKEFKISQEAMALNEHAYHRMGYFYIETANYKKALPFLLSALQNQNNSTAQAKGHLYYMLYLADSASGNYRSAIHYLRENRKVDEIINKQDKVKEIQNLVARYDAEKRNQEITVLKKNDQLHETNLKNAEFLRNVSIAGTGILLLGGVLFYRQNRKKLQMSSLITQKNKQLEVLLSEKEWLLKEIHHRVKNNLQTVISLLQIQSEFLQDDALKAVESSQHRIYAMSLIHQKLYLTDDVQHINLATYLRELVDYLKDSFGNESDVTYLVEAEPLNVDISYAITLGLIVNEAVSNSVKHAFPHRKNNLIRVGLVKEGNNIILKVSDNGVGCCWKKGSAEVTNSMGIKLIKGLSQDIDAHVDFRSENGTVITIVFSTIETKIIT
jgi:two-component sensor histidine kinase